MEAGAIIGLVIGLLVLIAIYMIGFGVSILTVNGIVLTAIVLVIGIPAAITIYKILGG